MAAVHRGPTIFKCQFGIFDSIYKKNCNHLNGKYICKDSVIIEIKDKNLTTASIVAYIVSFQKSLKIREIILECMKNSILFKILQEASKNKYVWLI